MIGPLSGQKWKSLGSLAALHAGGMLIMIGLYFLGGEYGLSAALLFCLGVSLVGLKRSIIDARTHFEAMLIFAGFYVTMLTATHSLDLSKLLGLGSITLLIVLLGRRYREILTGR